MSLDKRVAYVRGLRKREEPENAEPWTQLKCPSSPFLISGSFSSILV